MADCLVCIYGLHESGDQEIRYIGQTMYPRSRLIQHIKYSTEKRSNSKVVWLQDCIQRGVGIELMVLEECLLSVAVEREKYWIGVCGEKGYRLTNTAKPSRSPSRFNRRKLHQVGAT